MLSPLTAPRKGYLFAWPAALRNPRLGQQHRPPTDDAAGWVMELWFAVHNPTPPLAFFQTIAAHASLVRTWLRGRADYIWPSSLFSTPCCWDRTGNVLRIRMRHAYSPRLPPPSLFSPFQPGDIFVSRKVTYMSSPAWEGCKEC